MAEILYTGLVAADQMTQVVAHCNFTQKARFLAEQLPDHLIQPHERQGLLRFTYFESDPPCTDYTSGRIFQDDRELRWEKQGNSINVLYLGPEEAGLNFRQYQMYKHPALSSFKQKPDPTYYYLFGERLREDDLKKIGAVAKPGDFAVVRIPRILQYPVDDDNKRYARLVVCEYLEEATGRTVLFRFQRLETIDGAKNL